MTHEKRTMVVTIRLTESTVERLRALAEEDRRKLASYMAMVLEIHAEEKGKQREVKPKGRKS